MPFKEVERVIYKKNPVINAICQFRFPSILKIDSEIPVEFQNKIIKRFPLYNEKIEITHQFGLPSTPDLLSQLSSKSTSQKNHEFLTEENHFKINLTRNFITLSTSKYEKWETFLGALTFVLSQFNEIYSPPYFSRIGLRYIDVFKKSSLNLTDKKWMDLIKPEFLGLLSSDCCDNIESYESTSEIKLADNISMVRLVTSLVKDPENNEVFFMADSDFYNTQKSVYCDSWEKLNFLHDRATRLIRCIIKEDLHLAMEPEKL